MQSRQRRRFRVVTTDSKHAHPVAPNLLQRDFTASAPNQKWLADLTYVPTAEGWLYVALVLDLFSRKLVGWAMSATMPQELTSAALRMALGWRDPLPGRLIHHSDRGSQYAAGDYRSVLEARGITVSMSRKGDCWDNAPMESVNGTVKVEAVNGGLTFRHARRGSVRIGRVHWLLQHPADSLVARLRDPERIRAALARRQQWDGRRNRCDVGYASPTAGRPRFVASDRPGRPWTTLAALRGVHSMGTGPKRSTPVGAKPAVAPWLVRAHFHN